MAYLVRLMNQGDHIYVAGPLGSKGLAWRNVRDACLVGAEVFKAGFNPYVPHLMMHFDMIVDLQDEAKYRAHGLSFIPKCSGVVVFGFEGFDQLTGGTKGEVELALELALPVWYGVENFVAAVR
jgi:hypothetical protein